MSIFLILSLALNVWLMYCSSYRKEFIERMRREAELERESYEFTLREHQAHLRELKEIVLEMREGVANGHQG